MAKNNSAEPKLLARRINSHLLKCLEAYPFKTKEIGRTAKYAVQTPGHRWRPILFLRIYEMLSREKYDQARSQLRVQWSFSIRLRSFLDDLPSMDNALLRRRQKPLHLIFGEAKTVLAALWLCDVAQRLVRKSQLDDKQESQFDLEDAFRLTKSRLIMARPWIFKEKENRLATLSKCTRLKVERFMRWLLQRLPGCCGCNI